MSAGVIAAHYSDAVPGGGGKYSAEVLADSPMGYWRLGEASGPTMVDSSGNGHDGTYTDVTLGTPGAIIGDSDTAASFPGVVTSHADIPYESWMDAATAFSCEAWIKTAVTGIRSILDRDSSGSGDRRVWQFRLNNGNLQFIKISGGIVTAATTGIALQDRNWHHVVSTYDGANIRLYVDGSLVRTQAAAGSLTGSGAFTVGANRSTGTDGAYVAPFNGVIDEAAIYGTVLSPTRIAAHYAAGTGSG